MKFKTYSELSQLLSFEERYQYLRLCGKVGEDTFGFDRYLNQEFYKTDEWRAIRDVVIIRDNGCDLGVDDRWPHPGSPYEPYYQGRHFVQKQNAS